MGRYLVTAGSNNFLAANYVPATGYPMTVAGWFNHENDSLTSCLFTAGNPVDNNCYYAVFLVGGGSSGNLVRFEMKSDSGVSRKADTTLGYVENTWHHWAAVGINDALRYCYIDGIARGQDTNTMTFPTGLTRIRMGRTAGLTSGNSMQGKVAHVAFWDVALSDNEITRLAQGISPINVRQESLIAYWPITGQNPEQEFINRNELSLNAGNDIADVSPTIRYGPLGLP